MYIYPEKEDNLMFKIIHADFKSGQYGEEEYLDNWPMLYILENDREAYIGESNHVKTRMLQHASNEEKQIFKKVHFIYSKMFNQSVTFDYESKLIQYIVADQHFTVTNKNAGIADKQYFDKQEYDAQFVKLWEKLRKEKNVTVILITHYMEEVIGADQIYVMEGGHIVMHGTPKEIFSRVEELKKYRMDVPQVTMLADELIKRGIDLPKGILRKEELVEALCRLR